MSFFIYEGRQVYYEERGKGRPLLLLHGNTASSMMLDRAAERYSEHFRTIQIDFLGHGRSDRLDTFPADLWWYEALQVIAFLGEKGYTDTDIIGCSGGALVALGVASVSPDIVGKVIADSFYGTASDEAFVSVLLKDRAFAKSNEGARSFYAYMHGDDWEQIVDNDTDAIVRHQREIGSFFHDPLEKVTAQVLLTGSRGDKFMYGISDDHYERVYGDICKKIKNCSIHLFPTGDHPAMMSCFDEFYELSMQFLRG